MAVDIPAIREVVGRAFARKEVLDACERMVAARPEVELVSTRRRLLGPDD